MDADAASLFHGSDADTRLGCAGHTKDFLWYVLYVFNHQFHSAVSLVSFVLGVLIVSKM